MCIIKSIVYIRNNANLNVVEYVLLSTLIAYASILLIIQVIDQPFLLCHMLGTKMTAVHLYTVLE